MNAREYLKGLNEHDPVWDMADEFEYTEDQLINFAERYHERQLKLLRIGVVSNFVRQEIERRVDLILSEPDGIVRETMIKNITLDL